MAQAPKPPTPPPPVPPPAPPTQVNIHGEPPKPNMAPEATVSEEHLGDVTRAEMEAGRQTLKTYKDRAKAEYEAGQKVISRLNPDSYSKSNPDSKKDE